MPHRLHAISSRCAVGCLMLLSVAATGCSDDVSVGGPEYVAFTNPGGCVTDLVCPPGQECVNGTCRPIAPALRPHIQVALMMLRGPLDANETNWMATRYDLFIGGARPDEIRAINPNARVFDYILTRYHVYDTGERTAAQWAVAHGYDPEDFYLHFRENVTLPTWEGRVIVPGFPAGMVPGYNPGGPNASATQRSQSRVVGYYYAGSPTPLCFANIAHPGFRQFLAERTEALIDGTWYFNQEFGLGPLDGVLFDEALYYPLFQEGKLDKSTEYWGIPMNDAHPYAAALANLYPFMSETVGTLVGETVDVMPNYGHVMFLNYPNPAAAVVQTTTPWILGEVWLTHTGASTPTSGGNRCITYEKDYVNAVRDIVDQTRLGGRRVLGARDTSNGMLGTERGKIFTLGLYYLFHNPNTYYAYETVDQLNAHVSTWTWNPAVDYNIGQPATIPANTVDFEGRANTREHYIYASGADPYNPALTYRVFARKFTNALVLVKMLPDGSVVDNRSTTTHSLPGAFRPLMQDGTLGGIMLEASIRNNEALILIPEVQTGVEY